MKNAENYIEGFPGKPTSLLAGNPENFGAWHKYLFPELVFGPDHIRIGDMKLFDENVKPIFRAIDGNNQWLSMSRKDFEWLGSVVEKSANKVIINLGRFSPGVLIYHDSGLSKEETMLVKDVTKTMRSVLQHQHLEFPRDEKRIVEEIRQRIDPTEKHSILEIARRSAGISLLAAANSVSAISSRKDTVRSWLTNVNLRVAHALLFLDAIQPTLGSITAFPELISPGKVLGLSQGALHWQDPETLVVKVNFDKNLLQKCDLRGRYGELAVNMAALQDEQLNGHKLKLSVWE